MRWRGRVSAEVLTNAHAGLTAGGLGIFFFLSTLDLEKNQQLEDQILLRLGGSRSASALSAAAKDVTSSLLTSI